MSEKRQSFSIERNADTVERTEDGWYPIEEASAVMSAQDLKKKWEDLALDIALLPEKNVRIAVTEKGERIEISDTLYEYFFSS
jgi:hypothetical protein